MSKESFKEQLNKHPLSGEYEATIRLLRETRQGDPESREVNTQIDLLEDRLTELAQEIATNIGIPDPRRENPLWGLWDRTWKMLRGSNQSGRYEEEETIWEELKEIAQKIDLQRSFSGN